MHRKETEVMTPASIKYFFQPLTDRNIKIFTGQKLLQSPICTAESATIIYFFAIRENNIVMYIQNIV